MLNCTKKPYCKYTEGAEKMWLHTILIVFKP